jgi:hypothetical protein
MGPGRTVQATANQMSGEDGTPPPLPAGQRLRLRPRGSLTRLPSR